MIGGSKQGSGGGPRNAGRGIPDRPGTNVKTKLENKDHYYVPWPFLINRIYVGVWYTCTWGLFRGRQWVVVMILPETVELSINSQRSGRHKHQFSHDPDPTKLDYNTSLEAMNRTLRSVASAPALRRGIRHSAPSTNPSALLNSPSQYASLNVQSLRQECRNRGLKVSGRKAELVDRLSSYEMSKMLQHQQEKAFHSTPAPKAKDDSSTVDYCLMPATRPLVEDWNKPLFKIPVPPDAFSKVAKGVTAEYQTSVPDRGAADKQSANIQGAAEEPRLHVINSQARSLDDVVPVSYFSGGNDNHYQDQKYSPEEMSSRDKSFLAAFAAAVSSWWVFGKWSERKQKSHAN